MTAIEVYAERRDRVGARIIAEGPDAFHMSRWGRRTECGTTFCIAGHTFMLMEEEAGNEVGWYEDRHTNSWGLDLRYHDVVRVSRWLGLSDKEAERLFTNFDLTTPEDAALALKNAPYPTEHTSPDRVGDSLNP